jgi:hypothetical protein
VYLTTDQNAEWFIGGWGHTSNNEREEREFRHINNVTEFNEAQYILRVRSTGSFETFLVPRWKGESGVYLGLE